MDTSNDEVIITKLDYTKRKLVTLNISFKLVNLKILYCSRNQLTALILPDNRNITIYK